MTTIQGPGKNNSPEKRKETVERLLSEAATWEPKRPPTDFVARAMEKRAKKNSVSGSRNRGPTIWWGMGTMGVAAASVLFTITGKMPDVEPVPVTTPVVVTTPTPTLSVPRVGSDKQQNQNRVDTKDKTKNQQEGQAEQKLKPRISPVEEDEDQPHRSRRWRRPVRETVPVATAVKRPSTVSPVNSTVAKQVEPADEKVTATPASEMYETDDGRVLLPIILTHTSADGNEVTYTPAVVEMAYQPVNNIK